MLTNVPATFRKVCPVTIVSMGRVLVHGAIVPRALVVMPDGTTRNFYGADVAANLEWD